MSDGEFRRYRRRVRVTQTELAQELRISRMSLWKFEKSEAALPHDITPQEALEAVERILARRSRGIAGAA